MAHCVAATAYIEGKTDMAGPDRADTTEQGGASTVFAGRLATARWPMAVAICGLIATVFLYQVPWIYVLATSAAVIAAAGLVQPRRVLGLAQRPASRRLAIWPDTGMKMVVESLPQPCFITDRRGVVRYVNRAVSEQIGSVRPGDPLSFKLRMPSFLEALDRVAAGQPAERIRWSEKVPTERLFEAFVTPMEMPPLTPGRGAHGPEFLLVIVNDLSEQQRLERMRADFVANASHELRTPLASLTGFIETLQGAARDDVAMRERFLAIMSEQASRMARLIDDLLSLSRIEMRLHVRPSEEQDLTVVLVHVIDALTPLAEESGVTLERSLPDRALFVRGDRDELVQVFENLIENGIKYGASGGRVHVSARVEKENGGAPQVFVAIRDWGQGIADEHVPRLTERFYRVDVATSRQQKGTGLGLAIVKHILARHRGRLLIESAPGKGSTFIVRLEVTDSRENVKDSEKDIISQ